MDSGQSRRRRGQNMAAAEARPVADLFTEGHNAGRGNVRGSMGQSWRVWAWWVRGKTGSAFEKRYHSLNYILAGYWFCVANWTLVNTHFRIKLLFLCPLCMPAIANSAASHPPIHLIAFYTLAIIPFLTDHCLTHTRIGSTMHWPLVNTWKKNWPVSMSEYTHTYTHKHMYVEIYFCIFFTVHISAVARKHNWPLQAPTSLLYLPTTCLTIYVVLYVFIGYKGGVGVAWKLDG